MNAHHADLESIIAKDFNGALSAIGRRVSSMSGHRIPYITIPEIRATRPSSLPKFKTENDIKKLASSLIENWHLARQSGQSLKELCTASLVEEEIHQASETDIE